MTTLVIEDDRGTCEVARSQLAAIGGVTVARNMAELEAIPVGSVFDVIFLDMIFPGLSELDLFDFVRARVEGPIVVVTSITSSDLARAVTEKGAVEFIAKPSGAVDFAAAAKRAVEFVRRFPSFIL